MSIAEQLKLQHVGRPTIFFVCICFIEDRSLLVGPTAEMAEKLADRVVLVSRMLTALKSVGGAAYARTSESQAAAVKGLLLQTSLSLEHITAMLESIVAVP